MATKHLQVLDGWRGISILAVLACHLLPLGPKVLRLNEAAGTMGMALFFTLSGFLITRFLMHGTVGDFVIRRVFRIVPLAWVGAVLCLLLAGASAAQYGSHALFIANLIPGQMTHPGSHLWSLCVEVQFYAAIALTVAIFGKRGLYAIPVVCVLITLSRIQRGVYIDIGTLGRVDEILAGGTLALVFESRFASWLKRPNTVFLLGLLMVCSLPQAGPLNYLRPYVAALLVGSTLHRPSAILESRFLAYIAAISFALYVIHHIFMFTWLGEGDKLVKYAKRPLLLAATFLLAHWSTFHFEARWIALGRRLSAPRVPHATAR